MAKKPVVKKRVVKAPTLAQVTKWFTSLVKTGSYQTDHEIQAFFYDPIYSEDVELERAFEAWADALESRVPMAMIEWELVEAKNWKELHRFFTLLTPAQLAVVVPKAEAFVKSPKGGQRYREIEE